MKNREQNCPIEIDYTDDPANLPPDQIVTATQLRMQPGQRLADKAKELGVTLTTLRIWHAEWKGSQYDPDYVIQRAGHDNWLRNKWKAKDWTALVREEIAKGRARHIGDVLFAVGLTAANAQLWSQRHASFEQALWKSDVPHPKTHWRDYVAWIRHPTIEDYERRKAEFVATGVSETEAMHMAADAAVSELAHKTRQRRRIERDQLLGVGGHEELLRRYRGNAKLTDAHSRRIAKKLLHVSRWATMERALREVGYDEADIGLMMSELLGAFKVSDAKGQEQWKKTRAAVLRRRTEADAFAKAQEVEAAAVLKYLGPRQGKYVKEWAEKTYGKVRDN